MKSLKSYILEDYKTFRVKDLEIRYNCMPDQEYIKFYVPETYSEDDLQIYLQDMYFKKLPASEDNAEEYFGANASNIYDVLFEYDTYEKGVEGGDCVDWDPNIDNKHDIEKEDFNYVQIKGLQYVINFDKFDLKDENESDIDNTIKEIFTAVETHNDDFPLVLKLDEKHIKYKG